MFSESKLAWAGRSEAEIDTGQFGFCDVAATGKTRVVSTGIMIGLGGTLIIGGPGLPLPPGTVTVIGAEALADAPAVSVAVKEAVKTMPACELDGVKLNMPVAGLNEALVGRLSELRVTGSPSGSLAMTVKVRVFPTSIVCGPGTLNIGA